MQVSYFKKLIIWLRHNLLDLFFIVIILGIGFFVALKSYTSGTWLLGWDNLVPELNFGLNITRSLTAVWQEYQGLGLLGGMAHAAALPREIILWFASIFLPTSFLRYFWTFLMLLLGPVGVYFLIKTRSSIVTALAALTGSLFYLFNLGTLQTFFTPFETFVGFYGFFPWLLFLAQNYLRNGGRAKLVIFALVSFIATSAFYVQTLFIVYAIFLSVFALESTFRLKQAGLGRSLKLALTTFFINAFWLLPVIYFAFVNAGVPGNSHINSIATPETQIMNQARTGLTDVASLKGYWFDYYDWGADGSYEYLYKDWISYTQKPVVVGVMLGLFGISLLGLILGFVKRKHYRYSYIILFVICVLMLSGVKLPEGFLAEAFRNAYTKWATATALIYAVGIGWFISVIEGFKRKWVGIFFSIIVSVSIIAASLYTVFPVFSGNLIAKSMKVNLPSYYIETMDYLDGMDHTERVAIFPLTDFWGWQFNDWGYRGSGLLWHGIPQPVLSRTFDVWSPNNEAFYNEIWQAVNSENTDNLKYILAKYQIGYILFDDSVYMPGNPTFSERIDIQKNFILNSGVVEGENKFGKVSLFKVTGGATKSFISAPETNFEGSFIKQGQIATEPVIRESFDENMGYPEAKNCSLMNKGIVVKEKRLDGVYYKADNDGVSCDYFYYPELDSSKAYQMRMVGKNLTGRSLKYYLLDVAKQVVVAEELLPVGDFDKRYNIFPLTDGNGVSEGYTLNIETRAFGKVSSENLITGIEFYPVEFDYNQNKELPNNLRIENVKKYGTWVYRVDVQGGGLLQLGQGYETGWAAIQLQNSIISTLNHIKFNDWSNAWVVPSDDNNPSSTVYIFYWPQLLEWVGMVLGAGILLTLVRYKLY